MGTQNSSPGGMVSAELYCIELNSACSRHKRSDDKGINPYCGLVLAARIPSLRASLSGPLGEEHSVLKCPIVPHSLATAFVQLFQIEDLSVTSTNQVIAAIARLAVGGGEADANEKLKVHAPTMLKEVQWHLTTVQCRHRVMENYPTQLKSPECLQLMFQIANRIGAEDKDKRHCPFNIRAPVRQLVFFLFGGDNNSGKCSFVRVDQHLRHSERVADVEKPRIAASYSVVNGKEDAP
ncbi:hypothetical protein SprV_0501753200 [Sparganum proliferum]